MFQRTTSVYLQSTDATGVIYFTELQRFAIETFEEYLQSKQHHLGKLIAESSYLMPIVHVEADYSAPIRVGDVLTITLEVARQGTSSFTLEYRLRHKQTQVEAGRVQIVHVTVSKETCTTIPLPEELQKLLREI